MKKLLIVLGLIAINPLAWGWYGGFKTNADLQAMGVKEARDNTYRVVCGAYFEASIVERWNPNSRFWGDGWCEEYKERL
ncbi:hypothetical protein [Agrobacterium radiobacter]|uniref:hypothetical protein n=1 Tax=Agrobacterium radiobacter TaxID=362 RepID=UPI003CE4AC86